MEDHKDYNAWWKKFDSYFILRRDLIRERACFYQRSQLPGQIAEVYIRALYELAENCEFSTPNGIKTSVIDWSPVSEKRNYPRSSSSPQT